jgi:hypothetical protein
VNELDHRIRGIVRVIGESSPPAPDLETVTEQTTPAGRPLVGALVGFAAVGTAFLLLGLLRGSAPSASTGAIEAFHQIFTHRLEFELPCRGGRSSESGGFNEMTIESWADVAGMRFRERVVYPDGSIVDTINLGHPSLPRESWTKGESKTNVVECVGEAATGPLTNDPAVGIGVLMFDGPVGDTAELGYREVGVKQPGEHTDSVGRPAELYVDEWGQGSWLVGVVGNEAGDLLEVVFRNHIEDVATVKAITTLVSSDVVTVEDDHFDTTSYTLTWTDRDYSDGTISEGVEVEPTTQLGSEWIWHWRSLTLPDGDSCRSAKVS